MTSIPSKSTTYAAAGVDIDKGNLLVNRIKPLVRATSRPGADTEIGGFGGLFDIGSLGYNHPVLVSSTDGVGTKLKVAHALNKHDTIGIDLVAMCVNDLVVQGAEPLYFLDYFATGKLDDDVAYQVIKGIADGCKEAGCALIGGETAEMPGMYGEGEYDLAGFTVGAVEKENILPQKDRIAPGDTLIGLASSGVHSNGYSLVRHLLKERELRWEDTPAGFVRTLGEEALIPTRIYVKSCLTLIANHPVKGLAHITGGGLTENLPRVLPDDCAAEIDASSWQPGAMFRWLQRGGNHSVIEPAEMLKTFNCGIGMVLIVAENAAAALMAEAQSLGETPHIIGRIIPAKGAPAVTYRRLDQLFA